VVLYLIGIFKKKDSKIITDFIISLNKNLNEIEGEVEENEIKEVEKTQQVYQSGRTGKKDENQIRSV
jgi:hypothetical protein